MSWNSRSSRPDPNKVYVESFRNLVGGMNRFDLDFNLKGSETPFCQNLSWHNGVLCSRWGQVAMGYYSLRPVYAVAQFLWHGWLFTHGSNHIVAVKMEHTGEIQNEANIGTRRVQIFSSADLPAWTNGTFFRYKDKLFYKNPGCYVQIQWNSTGDTFTMTALKDNGTDMFTPAIQINGDPETGAGDLFQPENALSSYKTVKYNAKAVEVDGVSVGVMAYHLPVQNIDEVTKVVVDGDEKEEGTDYTVNASTGVVTFTTAPPVTDPPTNNTVEITYKKQNDVAFRSIMRCRAVAVFGGAQELCVVMGGTDDQPNAYFWSGNNGLVMDPTYFPINQYNLAGDNDDPITAFGKQQNMLVIFQTNATGRVVFGTETINGLVEVTMNYTRINAEIGCDLPKSLQLVENNLVWCNRRYGVCRLKDSSAAYENNIVIISRKINGSYRTPGLLKELESVDNDSVYSTDTGHKYMLVLGGKAYEWNYDLSEYNDPSWFYHTGIQGIGFIPSADETLYEVTADGVIAVFSPVFMDFEEPIEKIYTLPPRNFGSYDRLKNIKSMLFETRGDANTNTEITYKCDYASRKDPTNLVSHSWSLVPRNLTRRDLSVAPFASVFRRKPGFHNIRHLQVTLYNNEAGVDLSIVSAQILYDFRGRQR